MSISLPPVIAAFLQAHNSGVTDGFDRLFAPDAVVSDEQHEYRGSAIRSWIDAAHAKYQPHAEATAVSQVGDTTIVTAQVRGSFPGSPAELQFSFTLREGKISALKIA